MRLLEIICFRVVIHIVSNFVDTGKRVQDTQVRTCVFQHFVTENIYILHPFIFHQVGETFALYKKSDNTNLAILCSHNFNEPFNQPIEYAQKVGELTNMLGAGHILVQRYGDILDGKRTWQKELSRSNLRPSLPDAVAGDITSAMPYRAMVNIINFIQAVDHVVPGFAAVETLLYSPELKFYSNRVKMDTDLNTSIHNLHCLGDASGWTRGLMMASCMGVLMGRKLAEQENA